jgi:tail-like repeat protein
MASNGRFPAGGQTLGPVAEPEQADDVATKNYVDGLIASTISATNLALSGKSDTGHGHSQSDVTGLVAALSAKSDIGHTHTQANVTNLVSDLAGKAASVHTHAQSEITNLVSDLAGKAASNHTHSGLVTMARVAADVQQSSGTTFSNLFTIPILANEVWSFECVIYFLTAAATTGIVLQADSPSSPAASQISLLTLETATAVRNLTGAQGVALVGTAGLATVLEARLSGTIENGANAGNIVIKFRSEVNASAVTVKRGSWARFIKH